MKIAVRYYSRGGNVKMLAEALARGAGVEAVSIDEPNGPLTEPVDILFIGGALYNFFIDPKLKQYIADMPEGIVTDRVICFGSSFLTRRPIYLMQDYLRQKGFVVAPQAVYSRNKPRQLMLETAEVFAEYEIARETDGKTLRPSTYMRRAEKRREAAEAAEAEAAEAAEATETAETAEAAELPETALAAEASTASDDASSSEE